MLGSMPQVSRVRHDIHAQRRTPDLEAADLAATQHHVVDYRQLLELGLRRGAIQHRVRTGRFHAIHHRVYAVGHSDIGRSGFLMAAVLALGPGAVLSHRTAADHWGLIKTSSPAIHVTTARSTRTRPRGVIVHQVRQLLEADRAEVDRIPVTSVARTLLDLAAVARPLDLIAAIEQAERLRLFDLIAIRELLDRSNGRRGAKALRDALIAVVDPPDTRSPLEDRFVAYCRARKLPIPALNVVIAGYCVDAAWPSRNVVVELDSRRHHSGTNAFEQDRRRDTKLQVAGFAIVRITDRRLREEADELYEDLVRLLGL
jgi:predicted transcriptional regulator of viral defense system